MSHTTYHSTGPWDDRHLFRCEHRTHLIARDVSAIIVNGALHGEWANGRKLSPRRYAAIEYCQNPACERVFRAELKA